ncbi:MAG: hypothetical protein FD166_1291 [Bacteroidetes bacterium]|nr:MAG: hypothetical protein FD166_1291 [Bacteroidota bacterium]
MSKRYLTRPTLPEWILIIILAGFSALLILLSELVVPVHYNFRGIPDKTGNHFTLLLIPLSGIVIYILLKGTKRFTGAFNYPVRITPENSRLQKDLAFKLLDSYAVITLVVFNLLLVHLLFISFTGHITGIWIWGIIFLISYILPIAVYLKKAFSAKNNP